MLESWNDIGVELPQSCCLETLQYEPYTECGARREIGGVHWLTTADVRIAAGIWRLDLETIDEPVKFKGYETFQVFEGCAEVVVDGLVVMTLQPGDTGNLPSGVVTEWWITPPFVKFFVLGGGPEGAN